MCLALLGIAVSITAPRTFGFHLFCCCCKPHCCSIARLPASSQHCTPILVLLIILSPTILSLEVRQKCEFFRLITLWSSLRQPPPSFTDSSLLPPDSLYSSLRAGSLKSSLRADSLYSSLLPPPSFPSSLRTSLHASSLFDTYRSTSCNQRWNIVKWGHTSTSLLGASFPPFGGCSRQPYQLVCFWIWSDGGAVEEDLSCLCRWDEGIWILRLRSWKGF